MIRTLLFTTACIALSACTSGISKTPIAALEKAESEVKLRKEINTLSTYAIAKYAGLTEDPARSADSYTRLLKTVKDDPWVAEQAIFSVLRMGDVDRAVALSKKLPKATIDASELPRLTLAIDALKRNKKSKALDYLNQPWRNDYHAMLARSLAAWTALDEDPNAAIALQEGAGNNDGLFTLMGQTLAALMKVNVGLEDEALSNFDALWSIRTRLAIGVETEARLMASRGETEAALRRLREFRSDVGRHPALLALKDEIESGTVKPPQKLTAQQGTARAI